MLQITYHSRAEASFARSDFAALLSQCQRHNQRDSISGLLLYDGSRFLQAFEGPRDLVDRCMSRISLDARHTAVHVHSRRLITEREFGTFAMTTISQGENSPDHLLDEVKGLIAGVASPRLQALFIGFAAMRRPLL
jgi:hypothetical protein